MSGFNLSDLSSGGPVLLVLLLMSLLSVAVIATQALALRGVTGNAEKRDAFMARLEAGDGGSDLSASSPADRVAVRAAELLRTGASADLVKTDLTGLGNAEVAGMARGLRMLDMVGVIAPLLGLLGTVLGMIQSFYSLELAEGAANASVLAGGIWQALLTTAAGLIVAIPALIGASYLSGRVEAGTMHIERVIQRATLAVSRKSPAGGNG